MSSAKKILWLIIAGLFLIITKLNSGTHPRVGTTSANFLKQMIGPRAEGMGGAFVSIADDINSIHYNPAGLSMVNDINIAFFHNELYIEERRGYVGFTYPLRDKTLGFSFSGSYSGGMIRRDDEGVDLNDNFYATDRVITLAIGKKMGKESRLGGGLKFIYQKIDEHISLGIAADIGVLIDVPYVKNLQAGGVIRNLGTGKNLKILPIEADAGLGYKLLKEKLIISSEIKIPIDNFIRLCVGIEYNLKDMIFLRAGYHYRIEENKLGDILGFQGGIGVKIYRGKISFDYCTIPYGILSEDSIFNTTRQLGSCIILM